MAASSAKSALEIAIEICTSDSFKEAFIYPTFKYECTAEFICEWGKGIDKYTDHHYNTNDVDETLTDKVPGLVFCISHRMLTWLEHHTNVLRIPANVCLSLLTPDIFTREGIINDSKTVELLEDETLTNKKRFRLASWHCLRERSLSFFNMLDSKAKSFFFSKKVTDISETAIVKFFAYCFSGEYNLLKDKKEVYAVGRLHNLCIIGAPEDENTLRTVTVGDIKGEKKSYLKFRLESAIFSGSKPAVEFCVNDKLTPIESSIKNAKSSGKQKNIEYWVDLKEKFGNEIVDALISVVAHRMQIGMYYYHEKKNVVDDYVAFRLSQYNYKTELWVPSYFLVDTFFYLFSLTSSEEKRRIAPKLKEAIHLNSRIRTDFSKKLFNYFLCWPYQDRLMELVNSCWDHIEYDYFVSLLFDIFERIFPSIHTFHYGENKAFNYVQLFETFWCSTPDRFKRYIFEDRKKDFELPDKTKVTNCGERLMAMMITHNDFYKHHFSIIEEFLNSMTLIERKRMINTSDGQMIYDSIKEKTYSYLKSLLKISTESKDERKQLRKRLDSKENFLDMIKNDKYDEVDSFLSTLRLTDEQILEKKEKIILCNDGIQYCIELGTENPEKLNQFVKWFVPSSCSKFHKWHITLLDKTERLCLKKSVNEPELADQYLRFCYSLRYNSNTEIYKSVEQFKYNLARVEGIEHCLRLLFDKSSRNVIGIPMTERLSQLDKYLDWVFKTQPFDEKEEKKEDKEERNEDEESDHEINDKMIKKAKKTINQAKIMIKEAEKITKVDKLSSNEMGIPKADKKTKEKKEDCKEEGNENKKKEIKEDEESERERNDKMKIEKVKKTIKEAKIRIKEAEKKINEAEKKITEADKLSNNEMDIPMTDRQTEEKKEDGKEEGNENKKKEIKEDEESEHERNDKVVIEKAKKTIKETKIRIKEAEKKIIAAEKKINKVDMYIKVIKRKNKYKKKLLQYQNEKILYSFIYYGRFNDAEPFYCWAGSSSKDFLELRKSKLFNSKAIKDLFHNAMEDKTQNPMNQSFKDYIKQFLRWCLVDQKTAECFKEKFKEYVNDPEVVEVISKMEEALPEEAS